MRHLLVGATLLLLALVATFGVASVLQSRATAPLRAAPGPVAGEPDKPSINKLAPGEPGRRAGFHHASF
jgi:hypothetical protein